MLLYSLLAVCRRRFRARTGEPVWRQVSLRVQREHEGLGAPRCGKFVCFPCFNISTQVSGSSSSSGTSKGKYPRVQASGHERTGHREDSKTCLRKERLLGGQRPRGLNDRSKHLRHNAGLQVSHILPWSLHSRSVSAFPRQQRITFHSLTTSTDPPSENYPTSGGFFSRGSHPEANHKAQPRSISERLQS